MIVRNATAASNYNLEIKYSAKHTIIYDTSISTQNIDNNHIFRRTKLGIGTETTAAGLMVTCLKTKTNNQVSLMGFQHVINSIHAWLLLVA